MGMLACTDTWASDGLKCMSEAKQSETFTDRSELYSSSYLQAAFIEKGKVQSGHYLRF